MEKEIGGYIEFETYHGTLLHENAIALNCGRNALAYLCEARQIRKLYLPAFLCDSVPNLCKRIGVAYEFYSIDTQLKPLFTKALAPHEWLYLVNYYGQLSNSEIENWKAHYGRIVVDNCQSYFQMPVPGTDTLYTCRKYFGVADGAFLYTDARLAHPLETDESHDRMHFLLGRFERPASEFYLEYATNNDFFDEEPVKKMSLLTQNLLRGIDYLSIEETRKKNFAFLHKELGHKNQLCLNESEGTFMYPFMIQNGAMIRKKLQQKKIYIPTLWPSVKEWCSEEMLEYKYAKDILPLPIDQRYGKKDMMYIVNSIQEIVSIVENEEGCIQ